MFQLRGVGDDAWTEAASGEVVDMTPTIGDKIKNFFTNTPDVSAAIITPTPTTQVTTVKVDTRPWYKTPLGIALLLGGAFVSWKYIIPKLRKK